MSDNLPVSHRRRRLLAGAGGLLALAGCSTTAPPATAPAPPVAAAPLPPPRPPRIGLALGGGAARGFAHIGVIQVLEEQGIRPDLVVGTSAGSLVAALWAAGRSGAELGALAESMDESALTDWMYPGRGLLRGEGLARYVREHTDGRQIETMKLPLGIVATDLASGEAILFQRGDPGVAVRASSAVPAVFQPVRIGAREYVDGGLVAPVPVQFARQMGAELVIAVDISAATEGQPTGDALKMLLQTFAIMGRNLGQYQLREADVVMRPKLQGVSGADFGARRLSVLAGREAALTALADLRTRIAAKTHR
ncbi:patatin-like phospholipase family protein [Methylibium petroleiphilum]|uniref:patatin-like phospholipase family protein n=1 Tax=Methylibium petroleiphilum TaxID=105560 RepID=UPI001AD16264|nr:patatin-like phospholipase family protein [Methylibium petroleiphilum]MBN9202966.1 patatin-like phospholipase family protein [Methylibium petroleiphilum]